MKNANEKTGLNKVSEKGDKLQSIFENSELSAKSEKINASLLTVKTVGNKSFWRKDFLQSLSANDKKARRIARKLQFDASKKVVSDFQTKSKNLLESLQSLNDFYKKSLIDFSNFSQIDNEKEKGKVISLAYEILKKSL